MPLTASISLCPARGPHPGSRQTAGRRPLCGAEDRFVSENHFRLGFNLFILSKTRRQIKVNAAKPA
ncbi:hypothetical protein TRIP_B320002 [uncultured Desulfatiglans sp.]|uniref:Uncharacterized protein n=1 Tax=Uncultured Desulfatiglans sp. TaxID=1748965 RepID=A0A653A724_UNCDX|nr:hypothetical protein TRIP_B320002 [uncultured Desulfatiglans sp.]